MRFIFFFVFLLGMTVMSVEMSSSRFLAPYFGSSTIVWANIIGVIMLSMSLGYVLGGRIADRFPKWSVFYMLSTLGSVVLGIVPIFLMLILEPLSGKLLSLPFWEILGSFLVSLFFFGVPVAILSMLSPFAVKMTIAQHTDNGRIVGGLSAMGTAGSIFGVYCSTFFTIPVLGVRETIWGVACILFIVSLWGEYRNSRKLHLLSLSVLLLLSLSLYYALGQGSFPGMTQLAEKETLYQYVRILEKKSGERYMVFNEGGGIQSVYNPKKDLTGFYYDYYPLFQYANELQQNKHPQVLIIGYAGGTIGKLFQKTKAQSSLLTIDGVEIDPEVTKLSTMYMGVQDAERTLFTADGRTFLAGTSKKYDLIVVDAYTREQYIPPHLITSEFFKQVQSHLTDEGKVLLNINAKDESSPLLGTTQNTLLSTFKTVERFHVPDSFNYILVGGKDRTTFSQTQPLLARLTNTMKSDLVEVQQNAQYGIFTDNKNNVEQLTNSDVLAMLRSYIN